MPIQVRVVLFPGVPCVCCCTLACLSQIQLSDLLIKTKRHLKSQPRGGRFKSQQEQLDIIFIHSFLIICECFMQDPMCILSFY